MILFVNACVREGSRTRRLAERLLEKREGPVEEVRLDEVRFPVADEAFLDRRDRLTRERKFDDPLFALARQFAAADEIVIAAPCWDLSFPAALKQYLEQVNAVGVTFRYTQKGVPETLCRARRLTYVTTVGGPFFPEEFGFGYVRALAENVEDKQYDLVKSLLEAADYKEDESSRQKIEIKRDGKFLFEFTIRPLSEDEVLQIRKASAKYARNPAGKNLPKIETEVNWPQFKSRKIYEATIDEDREKIWDNPAIKKKFDLFEGWEAVDILLPGGWKNAVSDAIDQLSGYDVDLTDYAKN